MSVSSLKRSLQIFVSFATVIVEFAAWYGAWFFQWEIQRSVAVHVLNYQRVFCQFLLKKGYSRSSESFSLFQGSWGNNVVLESSRHRPHSMQNLSWSSPPSICPRRTWIKDQRCVGYSENWQPPPQEWCLHWENGNSFADQLIKCIVAATCLFTFEP